MALTYTPAADAGFKLPSFSLKSVDGVPTSDTAATRDARATLVAFICNHCPYVKAIEGRLIDLAAEFAPRGLATLAICSNDPSKHPEDAAPALLARWREREYGFPYLIDDTQSAARAFGAVCTPDFFLFGPDRTLVYRGRLDDSWRDPARVGKRELAAAVEAVLGGRAVAVAPNPSMGCSIKWVKS